MYSQEEDCTSHAGKPYRFLRFGIWATKADVSSSTAVRSTSSLNDRMLNQFDKMFLPDPGSARRVIQSPFNGRQRLSLHQFVVITPMRASRLVTQCPALWWHCSSQKTDEDVGASTTGSVDTGAGTIAKKGVFCWILKNSAV